MFINGKYQQRLCSKSFSHQEPKKNLRILRKNTGTELQDYLKSSRLTLFLQRFAISRSLRADDAFRIRIGRIRIVYTVIWQNKDILIARIGLRENVYD